MFRLTVSLFLLALAATAFSTDGKTLFIEKKCMRCHSIDSQQIEYTGKKEPHDLSEAGKTELDKAAVKAYLKKETEKNGKKHKVGFKGEDAELETLIDWLMTLK